MVVRTQQAGQQGFVTVRDYCKIMTAFPTGVAIVTTVDGEGNPCGLTTNALMSVSADPPILAVSVGAGSRTLPVLLETGRFCVNFMGDDGEDSCRLFASKADDKFDNVSWGWSAGGLPVLLDGVTAFAECESTGDYEIGDHVVVAGLVQDGRVPDDGSSPLLYVQRVFRRLPRLVAL